MTAIDFVAHAIYHPTLVVHYLALVGIVFSLPVLAVGLPLAVLERTNKLL